MPLPFARPATKPSPSAMGFDPEGLARALLGPNASPEDIQRMLGSIASAGPAASAMNDHPEPDPEPDGDPDDALDWTKGVAKNTEPFQYGAPPSLVGGAALAGAALPLAPLLAPAIGTVGTGLATGAMSGAGGAMAFGETDPAKVAMAGLGGAALGGVASKALPALGGALESRAPGLLRALSNTAKTDQAFAGGLGGELSLVPRGAEVPLDESALIKNQPVTGLPPKVGASEPNLTATSIQSPLSLEPYKQSTPWGWRVDPANVPQFQAPLDPELNFPPPMQPSSGREAQLLRNQPSLGARDWLKSMGLLPETTGAMRPPPPPVNFPPPGQGTQPLPGTVTSPTEDVDMEALMRALGLSR